MSSAPLEWLIGMIAPERNICGIVTKDTAMLAARLFLIRPMSIIARAPLERHMSGESARMRSSCPACRVIPITRPTTSVPTRLRTAANMEPNIFPITREYRDTGDTSISCIKSIWRSSTKLVMFIDVVINSILTNIPTSIKGPNLKFNDPAIFCARLPPMAPIIKRGKAKLIRGVDTDLKKSVMSLAITVITVFSSRKIRDFLRVKIISLMPRFLRLSYAVIPRRRLPKKAREF